MGAEQISLSAMAIYQNTAGLSFMIPSGLSTACATRCIVSDMRLSAATATCVNDSQDVDACWLMQPSFIWAKGKLSLP